uniref:RNA-directed RNA polymerase n=1 Tax=Panagrolaimus sp. ES5 TaxID=591445 RepID=A0AC34F872_9BILA
MSAIHCRLIFHDFPDAYIDDFLRIMEDFKFQTVNEWMITQPPVPLDSNSSEKNTEVQFSFHLSAAPEGRKLEKQEKYRQTCLALSELSRTFEGFRREFYNQGLSDSATVTLTVLSKNIYPQHFELHNIFFMEKLVFGSIIGRRNFAPTYFFDEPRNQQNEHEIFESYLDEQRDLHDIEANMLLCFEHDRECLTVCFPDIIKNWTNVGDDNNRSPCRVVDVRVSYAAIRRVIATITTEKNGDISATFTFQLNYPPTIQVYEMSAETNRGSNRGANRTKFKPPHRFLSWNQGHDIENALSHGSCLVADCRSVDPRTLLDCLDRLRKNNHYSIEFRNLYRKKCINIRNYDENRFMTPEKLPLDYEKLKPKDLKSEEALPYEKLNQFKYFPLVYAVQALITRGGELYDYFFRPQYSKFYDFLNTVIQYYEADLRRDPGSRVTKTVTTLENMLLEVDKAHDIMEPLKFFLEHYDEPGIAVMAEITDDLASKGYMRVRKIIVTPTRRLYINPELIMGNRILRKRGADNFLRIVFRDDDNHKVSILPKILIEKTVTNTLLQPMNVGFRDFSYLCSSNSQLRDHGTYYMAGTPEEVAQFRLDSGRFNVESIPKRGAYSNIFDYTGGSDSNGKPYTFSDGCGMISKEFARKIVADMKLGDCLPSCYQIRFRGYKGVVLMNPLLEETRLWAIKNNKPLTDGEINLPWYCHSLIFRPSQNKFPAPREKYVEIVKISAPILVSLNKPLINILDQVSEMHGIVPHNRMRNRIFELMEQHLGTAVSSLVEEPNAFLTLSEFPKYILYDRLRDFNVTEEPFFRSMLRSAALVGLHKLVDKMQIRIPASQGRMMFGVVDESGLLQSGQVFIQYTTNAALKYPSQHADKIILTGPVLITKNPSVVAGDVRMFEAVDLPCLYDLVDVVVFPQHGPRPHADEMAGSDLDGDEFSIFWDPQLFLDRTEPAFDFTSTAVNVPPGSEKEVRDNLTKYMVKFFELYVSQDSIGTIANAHLANSDLYGINSEHCHNIALKHNQAVDFPKNGQIPDELTKKWEQGLPPEKVERFPNFMCKGSASSYKSNRLLGELYNRAMEVREIIRVEEIASTDEKVKIDESVLMLGDHVYEDAAQTAYDEYRTLIGGICESYGILNEGQLFSGRFTALKKRISDKDDDNMSLFNTQHMIEEQVATIYAKCRSKFFDEFGGIERNTDIDERNLNGVRDTFRRICAFPSDQMRRKASAYYRVAYGNGKFLSFGWVVADILSFNRQKYLLQPENFKLSLCPLIDHLSNYIDEICKSDIYAEEFNKFCKTLKKSAARGVSTTEVSYFVANMCQKFLGLDKLLFFFQKWVQRHSIGYGSDPKNEISIRPKIMDAVVVMFGLGELKKGTIGWLTAFNFEENYTVNLEEQLGGLGKRFWDLIRFLMSRNFGFSERISLKPVTDKYLEPSQCLALYFAAEDTFYPIAVNRRYECLPGTSEDIKLHKITEGITFICEVPKYSDDYKDLFEKLAFKCGCKYLVLRRKPDRMNTKSCRVAVKPVGSFMAVRKFRTLLEVAPCLSEPDLQTRSDLIAEEVYRRLQFYTDDEHSVDDPFLP